MPEIVLVVVCTSVPESCTTVPSSPVLALATGAPAGATTLALGGDCGIGGLDRFSGAHAVATTATPSPAINERRATKRDMYLAPGMVGTVLFASPEATAGPRRKPFVINDLHDVPSTRVTGWM
jgi:hypothetical protein